MADSAGNGTVQDLEKGGNMTNETILERLDTMADQLHRATMAQDRGVIKEVCAINAEEAESIRADVDMLVKACEDDLPEGDPAHLDKLGTPEDIEVGLRGDRHYIVQNNEVVYSGCILKKTLRMQARFWPGAVVTNKPPEEL